ncbi:hypothetical protein KBZ10_19325 [Streptomyces sp. F63]|uniref:hypothetical protein n=1 Tax=Streptomyces sp. F63 TaxID=2824887 RepID=UPI001B358827|nr:hypothetical protein [Streptomyces sp. F63]MBQ0986622.1 hypothetical protein [Streptomyces sp. F63]
MSTMTTPPIPPPRRPSPGAVASGAEPGHRRHVLGDALHAIRVFAGAALSVVVLGDTGDRDDDDEPGRRPRRDAGHGPGPSAPETERKNGLGGNSTASA